MSNKCWTVTTPQILWHGGSIAEGKPDPVYSVDFHPRENVLLTTGIDASIPPRGSIRLWSIDTDLEKETFIVEFSDHSSVINVARFSPCGTMIASASHKQIIIYRVIEPFIWSQVKDIQEAKNLNLRQFEIKRFSPSVEDVVDLEWSPDSTYIIIGALEQKSEIIRISSRDKLKDNSLILPSHGGYVQGVAWDPYNQAVVTQSADRSVKVHKVFHRENAMVKLASTGHCVIKMYATESKEDANSSEWQSAEAATAETPNKKRTIGVNLFADSNVPSSFRRLSFSPDGSLLVVPTGVYRPPSSSHSSAATNKKASALTNMTFCTHLFLRNHYQYPVMSLVGLEDPSVAVRFNPRLFRLLPTNCESSSNPTCLFSGNYRMIFAVTTISCVFIYDTQHPFPLAKFRRLHFAPINDATWSSDGRMLVVCSSDGYLSIIRFKVGALGEVLPEDSVPHIVKISHPAVYGVSPSPATEQTTPTSSKVSPKVEEKSTNTSNVPVSTSEADHSRQSGEVNEERMVLSAAPASSRKRQRITPEKLEGLSLQEFSPNPSFSPEKRVKGSSPAPHRLEGTPQAPSLPAVQTIDLSQE